MINVIVLYVCVCVYECGLIDFFILKLSPFFGKAKPLWIWVR